MRRREGRLYIFCAFIDFMEHICSLICISPTWLPPPPRLWKQSKFCWQIATFVLLLSKLHERSLYLPFNSCVPPRLPLSFVLMIYWWASTREPISVLVLKLLKAGSGRGEFGRERGERKGKGEDLLQAAWCVYVNVCAYFRESFVWWVGGCVSQSAWASLQCTQPLRFSSQLSGNIMCLWDAQRNSPVSPDWDQNRQLKTDWRRRKVRHGLEEELGVSYHEEKRK